MTTLDIEHYKCVEKFIDTRESLPKKKRDLEKHEHELNKIETKNSSKYTPSDVQKRAILKDKIFNLNNEIYRIENYIDEMDYYADTMDILVEYFKDTDNDSSSISTAADSIMDFFTNDVTKKKSNSKYNKASLLDNYKGVVNNNHVHKNKKYSFIKYCKNCDSEKILNQTEGSFECIKCGETELVIIESDRPNYKDPIPDNTTSAYKRINHQQTSFEIGWLKAILLY
jgi:predicted RNA-binding Zn-ribbon protein involved in translation (DUF1610 family)